ncbi:hypothetical protein IWX50DRAFT_10591 [Phyllosticta citricarpa]|uniref:Uncharacterized protein n=1 Tax=Phyllosticta citricarpa TaxID=55181 RepID=A0ABR1MMD0_9PEZI
MLMHCQSHPKSNTRRIFFNSSCSAYASLDRAKTENSSMTMAVAVAVAAATWRWSWHWQNFDIHAHLYFSFPLLIFRLIADGAVWIWLLLDGWSGVGRYLGSFEAQGTHSVASFLHAFNSTFFYSQTYLPTYLPTYLLPWLTLLRLLLPYCFHLAFSRFLRIPSVWTSSRTGKVASHASQKNNPQRKRRSDSKATKERERERNQDNNQTPIQNNHPTAVVHISLCAIFAPIK